MYLEYFNEFAKLLIVCNLRSLSPGLCSYFTTIIPNMFIYTYILTDEQQQYYQTISLINFSSWEIVGSADNKFPSIVHVTGAASPKRQNVTANIPIKKATLANN